MYICQGSRPAEARALPMSAPVIIAAAAEGSRTRLILVHGTGHGGWCWYRVATLLRAAGHRVDAPDLAASGADVRPPPPRRAHLRGLLAPAAGRPPRAPRRREGGPRRPQLRRHERRARRRGAPGEGRRRRVRHRLPPGLHQPASSTSLP